MLPRAENLWGGKHLKYSQICREYIDSVMCLLPHTRYTLYAWEVVPHATWFSLIAGFNVNSGDCRPGRRLAEERWHSMLKFRDPRIVRVIVYLGR